MLTIIGGTYYEICREPQPEWDELFGSGLRAVLALSEKQTPLTFYTYADSNTKETLKIIAEQLSINLYVQNIQQNAEFFYEHPLKNPSFFPKFDNYTKREVIQVQNGTNVICFGMLEGNAIVNAERVVYDPQRPGEPQSFRQNSSSASALVMILNLSEAKLLTGSEEIDSIANYLFNREKVTAAIVKCGPDGAFLLEPGKMNQSIPAYMTKRVWPIGTGDIFTSYFGFQWMIKGLPMLDAATKASQATAYYANNLILPIPDEITNTFPPFNKKSQNTKTVYLAGPFFSMQQRWLIHEFRDVLISMGIRIFSPLHDVGIGSASEVVEPDIQAINECDLMVAVAEGLDSGTLFEIGYARAKKIPVIIYAENVPAGSLTMAEGTSCLIEDDFSTCIYKIVWELYK